MPSFAVDGVHQNKSHFTYILVIHWSNLWQLVDFSTISIFRFLYVVKSKKNGEKCCQPRLLKDCFLTFLCSKSNFDDLFSVF